VWEVGRDTTERYRISVRSRGRLYKALAHQVLEDETLSIELRSRPLKRHVLSGTLAISSGELTIQPNSVGDGGGAHHVHYHPSGQLRIKAFNGTLIRELSFPPIPVLHCPVPLLLLSVASVDQLDVDNRTPGLGDHVVDLDEMPVNRLQCMAWVGPKGSLKGVGPLSTPAQKILYEDAGLYDVAYIVGEGTPVSSATLSGSLLKDTRITAVPVADVPTAKDIPNREPEYWASPAAVARQVRAALEQQFEYAKERLAAGGEGAWEVRMSLCKDGLVVALDWNYTWSCPGYSIAEWYQLSIIDVLGILCVGDGEANVKDVYEIDPQLTDSQPKVCFVRLVASEREHSLHNAIVLLPAEHMRDRYHRIPRIVARNLAAILAHVDSLSRDVPA
jgi:hypothetical protein